MTKQTTYGLYEFNNCHIWKECYVNKTQSVQLQITCDYDMKPSTKL